MGPNCKIRKTELWVTLLLLLLLAPTHASATSVDLNVPPDTLAGTNVTVPVMITDVTNFDAGQFDIVFDPTKATLLSISNGSINSTQIPVSIYAELEPGHWRAVVNVPSFPGVTGNGTLANVTLSMIQGVADIAIENGFLNNNEAQEIPANWSGGITAIYPRGDATGDGRVNTSDITKIERIILMMDTETPGADINLDSRVNTSDVTLCERIILGYD